MNGNIESDKLYSKNKPNDITNALYSEARDKAYNDAITGIRYEIEMGPNAIAVTLLVNASDDIKNGRWTPSMTRRIVFLGQFTYSKDKIISATVDRMGEFSVGARGSDTYIGGHIQKPQNNIINVPDNINNWGALNENTITLAKYEKNPLYTTGTLSDFTSFGNGKFFYEGWETNPFTSNLI